MKLVYIRTLKKKLKIDRTVELGNGVLIDVNNKHGVVGVEVINVEELRVNGKKV